MQAIEIYQLSKYFKLYAHPRQILSEVFLGQAIPTFTALEDVSFSVARGEVVGIMGRNGAGKSTLLRILAGTLNASSGRVSVNGRSSAILELGSGFNPEYTGRENIISGGMCMGMSHSEVMGKIEAIIEFSQLREFIDQPFKTYSSGMQTRLTFATAIAVDPEILIVDEALAVGDARFQARCYERIQQFRDAGKSILLVSHSDNIITRFCDRAILLERGRLVMDGIPLQVVNTYSDLIFGKKESLQADLLRKSAGDEASSAEDHHAGDKPDTTIPEESRTYAELLGELASFPKLNAEQRGKMNDLARQRYSLAALAGEGTACERLGNAVDAEILHIFATDEKGEPVSSFIPGEKYSFGFMVLFYEPIVTYVAGYHIRSSKGVTVHGATTFLQEDTRPCFGNAARGDVVRVSVDVYFSLTNDTYLLTFAIANYSPGVQDNYIMDGWCDAFTLPVANKKGLYDCSIVDLEPRFNALKLNQ